MSNDRAHETNQQQADRWIGVAVVVLAFLTIVGNLYALNENRQLRQEDDRQRDCIAQSFHDLTEALQQRVIVTNELNKLKEQKVQLLQDRFDALIELFVLSASDTVEQQELRKQFFNQVDRYRKKTIDLNRAIEVATETQKKTPVPPYPEGKCA